MTYSSKVFLASIVFILTIGVAIPLASITSVNYMLEMDCLNPNYVARNSAKHADFCNQKGWENH